MFTEGGNQNRVSTIFMCEVNEQQQRKKTKTKKTTVI